MRFTRYMPTRTYLLTYHLLLTLKFQAVKLRFLVLNELPQVLPPHVLYFTCFSSISSGAYQNLVSSVPLYLEAYMYIMTLPKLSYILAKCQRATSTSPGTTGPSRTSAALQPLHRTYIPASLFHSRRHDAMCNVIRCTLVFLIAARNLFLLGIIPSLPFIKGLEVQKYKDWPSISMVGEANASTRKLCIAGTGFLQHRCKIYLDRGMYVVL